MHPVKGRVGRRVKAFGMDDGCRLKVRFARHPRRRVAADADDGVAPARAGPAGVSPQRSEPRRGRRRLRSLTASPPRPPSTHLRKRREASAGAPRMSRAPAIRASVSSSAQGGVTPSTPNLQAARSRQVRRNGWRADPQARERARSRCAHSAGVVSAPSSMPARYLTNER
jgi:hypothetical protein